VPRHKGRNKRGFTHTLLLINSGKTQVRKVLTYITAKKASKVSILSSNPSFFSQEKISEGLGHEKQLL
jgi:hypothetical protein